MDKEIVLDMVPLIDEDNTMCVVYDTTPKSTQKRINIVVRSKYSVQKVFQDVAIQFQYENFELILQTFDEDTINHIYLNDKKDSLLYKMNGFKASQKNQLILMPTGSWENKEEFDLLLKSVPLTLSSPTSSVLLTPPAEIQTASTETETSTGNSFVVALNSSPNMSPVTPDAFDYDLALGASASPTEESDPSRNQEPPSMESIQKVLWANDNNLLEKSPSASLNNVKVSSYQQTASTSKTLSHKYTGLVNQAMTCYLNSLLQALFMTPEFRNALYRWEFDNDNEAKNIPYQLQKLFLNLQTTPKSAVETTDLTRSFGWDSTEAWEQHDIQELCRVMFDALEHKFQKTKQAKLISNLYEGKLADYVKCLECNTEKIRADTFLDIPLPVRPFGSQVAYSSIEEALRAFVQPETLDGNNQYFCEKCNKKCDAHKGLKFKEFPYILTLHLKRFDFDYTTLHRIKLNDKVTFPQNLNLNAFVNATDVQTFNNNHEQKNGLLNNGNSTTDDCSDSGAAMEEDNSSGIATTASSSQHENDMQDDDEGIGIDLSSNNNHCTKKDAGPYLYELFAIMIHSGSATGGHYYAYIKDFESGEWFCFNDQSVSPITQEDIQKSFGGCSLKAYYSGMFTSSTNAYMLMYRQMDSKRNEHAFKQDDFPEHLAKLLEKIGHEEENRRVIFNKMSDIVKPKVYFYNSKLKKMKTTKIYVSGTYDLMSALESAYDMLGAKEFAPMDRCRLVLYDHSDEVIIQSFEDQKDRTIGSILDAHLPNVSFLLEYREEGEEFEPYKVEEIQLKCFKITPKTYDIAGPYIIRALKTNNNEDMKKEIAKRLKLDESKFLVYKSLLKVYVMETDDVSEEAYELFFDNFIENLPSLTYFYITHQSTDPVNLNILGIPTLDTPTTPSPQSCDVVDAVMMNGSSGAGDYNHHYIQLNHRKESPLPPAITALSGGESNSEDSSLSDGDRTLVGGGSQLSSASNSPPVLTPEDENPRHKGAGDEEELFPLDHYFKALELSDKCDYHCHSSLVHNNSNSITTSTDEDNTNGASVPTRTFKIILDKNMPIGELKRHLEPLVQVPIDYFKVQRKNSSSMKHEEINQSECVSYFCEGEELKLELGKILKKDEHQAKIYYMKLSDLDNDTGKLMSICNWVLKCGMPALDAKKQLIAKLRQLDPIKYKSLTIKNCRMWEMCARNLVKILPDDQKLGLDGFVKTIAWEFLLQECEADVQISPPEDSLTLFVRRWHPSTLELDGFQEIIMDKNSKIMEKLASISDIPAKDVAYSKINGAFPGNNISLLNINTSMSWFTNEATIENYPLLRAMSGSIFFYKNSNEGLKELTTEERRELNQKEKVRLDRFGASDSTSTLRYSRRMERALKIYVDSSPKSRSSQDD